MNGAGASDLPVRIEPVGETMLLLRFGEQIDAALNAQVHAAAAVLRASPLRGLIDLIPAYATLALRYEPRVWIGDGASSPAIAPWRRLADAVRAALSAIDVSATTPPEPIDIPVRYGGAHGPDLDELARHAGLSTDEVIARHTRTIYRVAMLGFAPGFPYLLGLDPALHMPRRADPRRRVAAGSVAIGGAQTGIYPRELPGGWQLIGQTPLVLFDAQRAQPALLAPGDRVRFVAIDTNASSIDGAPA